MTRARSGSGGDRRAGRGAAVPAARVPQTRIARLAGVALAAGELALAGLGGGVRRLLAGGAAPASGAWVSVDHARRLAARLARLRGGAMKVGQMMSMQGPDLLPPEFAQALAILRAQAAPMPLSQLHGVLGREYGRGWRLRFEHFDEEPLAAASIGQVHRARTIDGRELALKIQYPGVARSIRGDIDNVVAVLRLLKLVPAQADIDALAVEAVRQLSQEADYLAEAASLERFASLVADEPRLRVPRAHADLTTARILAMDFLDGRPLDALAAPGVPQSMRNEVGALLERLVFRELFEFRTMQTDPNFANYLWQPDSGRIVLLDFGATTDFDAALVAAYARITRAAMAGDRRAVARGAIEIGYLDADDPAPQVEATVDVILLVCEPLRHRGRYDFAASDLPSRARALGFDTGIRQGLLRVPPAQTMFLHRKLIGSFFLLAHIGARVDVRSLLVPLLRLA